MSIVQTSPRAKRVVRRCLARAVGAAVVLVVPLAAWTQEPPAVGTAPVERDRILREVDISGSVVALNRSRVSTAVAGRIDDVPVRVGERVEAGDRLVSLDDELQSLTVRSGEAEVAEYRSRLQEAQRLVEEAEAAGARTNIAQTELEARRSDVAITRALLEQRRAEAERATARRERHQIDAPFDGVVLERHADPGEWVEPGTAVVELIDPDALVLELAVPQDVYAGLNDSAELSVRFEGARDERYPATIDSVLPVTSDSARTFRIRASVTEPPRLAAGMSVRGTLRLPTGEQGLLVPRDAITRHPEGRVTVWVITGEGDEHRVREQRVVLGSGFGDRVVVRDGLDADDRVVTRGNNALEDGQTVTTE